MYLVRLELATVAIILALAAALVVGSGDFFGGVASRHGRVLAVVLWVHLVGIVAMAVLGPLVGGDPTAADLAWGAAAGVAGAAGVGSLYVGFSASPMGVVAPVSAVVAAGFPVLFGVATGERPSAVSAAGLAVGLVAIALVSRPSGPAATGSVGAGVAWGMAAGLAFGALFVLFSRTADGSGIWPVLPARLAGAAAAIAVVAASRAERMPRRTSWPAIGLAGVLTVAGNGLFVLASQRGLLAVVSVLTSMYPAATVAWARVVFKERLGAPQLAGVALALAAVALIAGG